MRRTLIALALTSALLAGACGGDDDDASDDGGGDGTEQADGTGTDGTAAGGDGRGAGAEGSSPEATTTDGQAAPGVGAGGREFCAGYADAIGSGGDAATMDERLRALVPPGAIADDWTLFVDSVESGTAPADASTENETLRAAMDVANWAAANCAPPHGVPAG